MKYFLLFSAVTILIFNCKILPVVILVLIKRIYTVFNYNILKSVNLKSAINLVSIKSLNVPFLDAASTT